MGRLWNLEEEYGVERISSEKLGDLVRLYAKSVGDRRTLQYFQKKFATGVFGVEYVGYIAYCKNGEPAAYYGVFPIHLSYGGRTILGAQSGNTMTHPDHRGKGLFIFLASRTYDLARDLGIQFIFGFPNKSSYPGFVNRLGWVHREDMRFYSVKVKTIPVAKIAKKIDGLEPLYKEYQRMILKRLRCEEMRVKNLIIEEGFGGVIKDDKFVSYKSYSNNFLICLKETAVWLKVDRVLLVGDVGISVNVNIADLLKDLRRLAGVLGCTEIHFGLSPGVLLERILCKHLNCASVSPIGYLDLGSCLPLDKFKYTLADADFF